MSPGISARRLLHHFRLPERRSENHRGLPQRQRRRLARARSCLFAGTERFFRPNYRAHLINEWIPALEGVEAKLKAGGRVADVGCGLGTSTILMAQAYPKSSFMGFDYHPESIELAREAARKAGVSDRVKFEVAKAKDYPGKDYDFVAFFDCLHDMGDPDGAARHVLRHLVPAEPG